MKLCGQSFNHNSCAGWKLGLLFLCTVVGCSRPNYGGFNRVLAFAPSHEGRRSIVHQAISRKSSRPTSIKEKLDVTRTQLFENSVDGSFVLSSEEVKPIIKFGSGESEKVVNAFGLWALVVSLITGPIWQAVMSILNVIYSINKNLDPDRSFYDSTGKAWAKSWLTMTFSYPTFSGEFESIKNRDGPCLYVANHASWLDIPVLCTILEPVFKFIAKGELKGVPCIGTQLSGGNHILIDRDDRRSQLRTFKEGVGWLKKGVPIMAFPEGMRSRDGRLMEFKGGIFAMAMKTGVPIVPISVANTHAVMPSNALFPVQSGAGKLHIHVHPPIETEGRTDVELVELVREALLSKLPEDQHPLPTIEEVIPDSVVESKAEKVEVSSGSP